MSLCVACQGSIQYIVQMKVINNDDFEGYSAFFQYFNIIVRVLKLILDFYLTYVFLALFRYYIKKK